ncbi:MAG: CDP-diacylglycerol--glycerol-3-phosphate 3-phosphatidyltransferase [Rhodoluna sp.]
MNIPNAITLARIALVPIFVFLLLIAEGANSVERWVAIAVFVLAISTDGLDGAIARKTNKVTNLGKILDPIADKALLGGALLTLSLLGEIDWWITVLILARELSVTLYRVVVVKRKVIAATQAGKLKTIFQGVAIGAVLAPFEVWASAWTFFEQGLLFVALGATLISGAKFFLAANKK